MTGHEHAFIVVSGGHGVPVMAVKGTDGEILAQKVYIRKPGPKSEEPFTADEWRTLLDRCVRANRDSLLDAIRDVVQGRPLDAIAKNQLDRLLEFTNESRDSWQNRIDDLPTDDPARFLLGSYELSFHILDIEPVTGLRELLQLLKKSQRNQTYWLGALRHA